MKSMETQPFKTTLQIKGETGEFNLKSLLDLFQKNKIKITFLGASNRKPEAEQRVTEKDIPMEDAFLVLEAPQEKIRAILEKSEFKDKIDELFGHGLN